MRAGCTLLLYNLADLVISSGDLPQEVSDGLERLAEVVLLSVYRLVRDFLGAVRL